MVPLEFLQESKLKMVSVHTTDKNVYTGILKEFDAYVNIILSNATFLDLETKNTADLGTAIVQGNTVAFIDII